MYECLHEFFIKTVQDTSLYETSDLSINRLLLLRLPAAAVFLLLPQNNLLTSLAFTPDSYAVSATRISLMASSSSFIYLFFWPLLETHNHLPCLLLCMTRYSFRHVIPVSINVFYSNSKTDLKLRCDCCIKFPLYEGTQDVVTTLTAVCCMLLPHNP